MAARRANAWMGDAVGYARRPMAGIHLGSTIRKSAKPRGFLHALVRLGCWMKTAQENRAFFLGVLLPEWLPLAARLPLEARFCLLLPCLLNGPPKGM